MIQTEVMVRLTVHKDAKGDFRIGMGTVRMPSDRTPFQALRAHRRARDTIVSQDREFPVRLSVVKDAPDGSAVFLTFRTDAEKRGNTWLVQIDTEDFGQLMAAMMAADPFACQ